MTTLPAVDPSEFYNRLAPTYRDDFEVQHRKAYDTIAAELVRESLPASSTVVDVGCGVGRWVDWLLAEGHDVIGVEPSPAMAAVCRSVERGRGFTLLETDADHADIRPGSVDAVVAMGSIQYAPDPVASIARMAGWIRPGGRMWLLVDSLGGLVQELLRRGDVDQAVERATTRRGRFGDGEVEVEHHLFDATSLASALAAAGLTEVRVGGLLVAWSTRPRSDAQALLEARWHDELADERRLWSIPDIADLGKQLLGTAVVAV